LLSLLSRSSLLRWALLWAAAGQLAAEAVLGTVGERVPGQVGLYRFAAAADWSGPATTALICRNGITVGQAELRPHGRDWQVRLKGFFDCQPGDQVVALGVDFSFATPDLCQRDARLPDQGSMHCAPTAVANTLLWLGHKGALPPLAPDALTMVEELAHLMGTDGDGTSNYDLRDGLSEFLQRRGLSARVEGRGIFDGPTPPRWLHESLSERGGVWLNFGFYEHNARSDLYVRSSGHWVTLVGYSGQALFVHDPAARAGIAKRTETLYVDPIQTGLLQDARGKRRSARGFLRVRQGLALPSKDKVALLDGAVRMHLAASGDFAFDLAQGCK